MAAPSRVAERGHLMIIEDEPVLAAAMARQLAGRFEVEIAHDAHDALRALERTEFDVVLCDVRLPGLSGMQLFEAAARGRPELAARFVLLTGAALDGTLQDFVRRHGIRVLEKPFDAMELDRVVLRAASAS